MPSDAEGIEIWPLSPSASLRGPFLLPHEGIAARRATHEAQRHLGRLPGGGNSAGDPHEVDERVCAKGPDRIRHCRYDLDENQRSICLVRRNRMLRCGAGPTDTAHNQKVRRSRTGGKIMVATSVRKSMAMLAWVYVCGNFTEDVDSGHRTWAVQILISRISAGTWAARIGFGRHSVLTVPISTAIRRVVGENRRRKRGVSSKSNPPRDHVRVEFRMIELWAGQRTTPVIAVLSKPP